MTATILGLIVIFLVLLIFFQIAKASELISVLKGEEKVAANTNKIHAVLFLLFLIFGLVGSVWSAFHYAPLFLPEPSSEHGVWLRTMFFWTLVATVPVFIVTHILLFGFSFKYQKKKGNIGYYYPHNNRLEMIWTIIPAIVLILLVYEGMRNWYKITGPAPQEAMVVEATGQQFLWHIRYSGADNKLGKKHITKIEGSNTLGQDWADKNNHDDFFADEIHLPVGKPVVFKIGALDVLHSFYLPHFRVKMDAVPGVPTQFWFTPTRTTAEMREELGNPKFNYELACAELCGQAHYNMRKVVVIESEEDYQKWLKEQKPLYAQIKEQGKATAEIEGKDNAEVSMTSW